MFSQDYDFGSCFSFAVSDDGDFAEFTLSEPEEIVCRGMTMIHSQMPMELDFNREQLLLSNRSNVQDISSCKLFASLGSVEQSQPSLVPPMLMNQTFDVCDSTDGIINKVDRFLGELTGIQFSFSPFEFAWNCRLIQGLNAIDFEISIYRYPHSQTMKSGMFMMEMRRISGDRLAYFSVYNGLRSLFDEQVPESQFEAHFEAVEEESIFNCDEVGPVEEEIISEEDIKSTLLNIISSVASPYQNKLEAVQLVGASLVTSYQVSALDMQLLSALEILSVNDPNFFWLAPFVTERKQSIQQPKDITRVAYAAMNAVPVYAH